MAATEQRGVEDSAHEQLEECHASDVWLVEEVPGVPPDEAYFVTGPQFSWPYPHFATKADGEAFLREHGITDYKFEPYEP